MVHQASRGRYNGCLGAAADVRVANNRFGYARTTREYGNTSNDLAPNGLQGRCLRVDLKNNAIFSRPND